MAILCAVTVIGAETIGTEASAAKKGARGLPGIPLEQIRKQYRADLFDDFLPFVEEFEVDHEYGGFMTSVDHDGTIVSTEKTAYSNGRGIWTFSFLYNNIDRNPKYLEIARKAVEFMMKHQPAGDDFWPATYTREGKVVRKEGRFPSDCYLAEGLAEYARATNNEQYFDLSKEIILKCLRKYDDPSFRDSASPYPGARNLWYWMQFLWYSSRVLEYRSDTELETLAERCVDAIMNRHVNPKYNLMNDVINHDLTISDNPKYNNVVYCAHGTESLWMVMYEARRRKDERLFRSAADLFRRHVEVSRDDVYGGVFNRLNDVEKNVWDLRKIHWAQEFVLIGSLLITEQTGEEWAKNMFDEQYLYVQEKFPLRKHGFKMWIAVGDRHVSFTPHVSRKEIYHHPRHLMLNLMCLDRMRNKKKESK